MIWNHYVFRKGVGAKSLWEQMFRSRKSRLIYITGRGFDYRAQFTLRTFVESIQAPEPNIESAHLLQVEISGYQLSPDLTKETEENSAALSNIFEPLGGTSVLTIGTSIAGEDDMSPTSALRVGIQKVLEKISDHTDIILDVSSFPRVAYLAIMTGVLDKLIPNKHAENALYGGGINFQVIVAEDSILDGQIRPEDPSDTLVLIPGYSSSLYAESVQHWPTVWFPILGENRLGQFLKVNTSIPELAEVCPVVPSPSRDPRRADKLIIEYKVPLFENRQIPTTSILLTNEANPFEVYRQLFRAMMRYKESMVILGGCRLIVTPLSSKLITLGAGLACFEMRPLTMDENFGVAIPYAEPRRYTADIAALRNSKPEISALLLTGTAFQ